MNSHMDNSTKIWVVTIVTLVAIAVVAALWASYSFSFPQRPLPTQSDVRGDLEFFYVAQTVVSTVNVSLLIFLLTTYVDIYRKTRSQFTFGLIIFSLVFLLRTLTANPLFMRAFGFAAFGLGPFALLPELFECAALAILLYLSAKY
jgi:hypothetical protein